MDFWTTVLLLGGFLLLLLWFLEHRKKEPGLFGLRELRFLSKPKEVELMGKKEELQKANDLQKLDELWLKKQVEDLVTYTDSPSVVYKFFVGLRHTFVNPMDVKVIESYEKKFKAATQLIEAGSNYIKARVRTVHLKDDMELENLERESKILEKKLTIAGHKQSLKKLEGENHAQAKVPTPEESYLRSIKGRLATFKAKKTAAEMIMSDLNDSIKGFDPERDKETIKKIKNMYTNFLMEQMEK